MATPTGPRADAKRAWYRRRRRLLKKNVEDYGRAGTEPPPLRILEWFVDDGGSGYAVGDQVSLDAFPSPLPVIAEVTAETGGVVDEVKPVSGTSQTDPGTAFATTAITGSGVGLTLEPSTSDIHNFGPTAPGGDAPFPLFASGDTIVAFEPSVALAAGDFQIDADGFETFESAEPVPALGIGYMRRPIPRGRNWTITRSPGAPACTIKIYYRVKSQLVQIAEVTYT